MRKVFSVMAVLIILTAMLVGCAGGNWSEKFDTSMPTLAEKDGWQETMNINFADIHNLDELKAVGWAPSPHGRRNYEFWCDDMVEFTNQGVIIHSEEKENHQCETCNAIIQEEIAKGEREAKDTYIFTSGIETRDLFEQAFGYFETEVIVPRGSGMWSAFWLQSNKVGNIGHQGRDGSEIDVYESSFMMNNPTKTGAAIHYDAYNPPFYRCGGNVTDVKYNLYDGEVHKYALKWTPEEYVIYVDGVPTWATNYGGVSRTAEFLRLTVEIRDQGYGPYGEKIGTFSNDFGDKNDFVIKSVKVYQNENYKKFIQDIESYKDMKSTYMGLVIGGSVVGGLAVIGAVVFVVLTMKKRKANVVAENK